MIRSLFLGFLLLFVPDGLCAQDDESPDHLLKKWEQQALLHPDSALAFASAAWQMSTLLGDRKSVANSNYALAKSLFRKERFDSALVHFSEAVHYADSTRDSIFLAKIWVGFGQVYHELGETDTAFQLFTQAVQTAETHAQPKTVAEAKNRLAAVHQSRGKLDESLRLNREARALYLQEKDTLRAAMVWMNISWTEMTMSNFERAMEISLEVHEIADRYGYHLLQGSALFRTGTIYYAQNLEDQAKEFYLRARSHFKSYGHMANLGSVYGALGDLEFNEGNPQQGIVFYERAATIWDSIQSVYHLPMVYARLGWAYLQIEAFDQSLQATQKALLLSRKMDHKRGIILALYQLGEYYAATGSPDLAEKQLFRGVSISQEHGLHPELREGYLKIATLFEDQNDFEKALNYFHLHEQLKDSLYNVDRAKRIDALVTKHEIATRENELKLMAERQSLQQSRIERQDLLQTGLVALIGLLLALVGLSVLYFRHRLKTAARMAATNKALENRRISELKKDREIETVKAMLTGQEMEKERISQELHDGIAGDLFSVKMQLSQLEGSQQRSTEMQHIIDQVGSISKEVRNTSHQLRPPKLFDIPFHEAMTDLMQKLRSLHALEVTHTFFPKDKLNAMPAESRIQVYRIVQELTNNVLKHAQATQVEIHLTLHNSVLDILVADDGCGYDPTATPTGLGLQNLQARVSLLKGDLQIKSHPGKGTQTQLQIPIS